MLFFQNWLTVSLDTPLILVYFLDFVYDLQGSNLKFELDSLHGQATVLAALVSISPKLPLGYPARY